MSLDNLERNEPVKPAVITAEQVPGAEKVSGTQLPPNLKKSHKKPLMILGIVILALVVLGGSAAAYFMVYLPNKPENVLLQALYNSSSRDEVKSGKIDGTVKLSGEGVPLPLGDIDITASYSDSGDVTASISTDIAGSTVTAEYRMIDEKDNYIKLDGLKNIDKIMKSLGTAESQNDDYTKFIVNMLSEIDGQWIALGAASDQVTGGATGLISKSNLSQEDSDKIAELYQKSPVLEIKEVMADEDVNGEASYHYEVEINKENLVTFLTELKSENIDGLPIEQSMIESAKDMDTSKTKIEIWINKADKLVNQILISGSEDGANLELRLAMTGINQPVSIEAPEGAVKFEELLGGALGGAGATPTAAPALSGL